MKLILTRALLIICIAAVIIDRFVYRFPDKIYISFMIGCVLIGFLVLITERKKETGKNKKRT